MASKGVWAPPLSYDEIFPNEAGGVKVAGAREATARASRIGAGRLVAILFLIVAIVVVAGVGAALYWDEIGWGGGTTNSPNSIAMNSILSHRDLLLDPPSN